MINWQRDDTRHYERDYLVKACRTRFVAPSNADGSYDFSRRVCTCGQGHEVQRKTDLMTRSLAERIEAQEQADVQRVLEVLGIEVDEPVLPGEKLDYDAIRKIIYPEDEFEGFE